MAITVKNKKIRPFKYSTQEDSGESTRIATRAEFLKLRGEPAPILEKSKPVKSRTRYRIRYVGRRRLIVIRSEEPQPKAGQFRVARCTALQEGAANCTEG